MNTELTLDPQFNPQSENKIQKSCKEPWNKGKLMGQKPPLKLKEVWEIRIRLQLGKRLRELALFNLAIDSKLRGCDLVKLKVRDVAHGEQAIKTGDGHATKDPSAGTVRNHRSNPNRSHGMDKASQTQKRRLPVSEPYSWFAPYYHPAICTDSGEMGRQHRT